MMDIQSTLAFLENAIFVPYKHKTRYQEQKELEEEERWLNLSSIEVDYLDLDQLSFESLFTR